MEKSNPFQCLVTLLDDDMALIEETAQKRQENKERRGVPSKKMYKQRSEMETHRIGLVGEFAVARLLNIEPDLSIRELGDNGVDHVLYGMTIDTKSRPRRGRLLFYPGLIDFKADIAVLAWPEENVVHVQGWATKATCRIYGKSCNFGYGERLGLKPGFLHPISTLSTYCMMSLIWRR